MPNDLTKTLYSGWYEGLSLAYLPLVQIGALCVGGKVKEDLSPEILKNHAVLRVSG